MTLLQAWKIWKRTWIPLLLIEILFYALLIPLLLFLRSTMEFFLQATAAAAPTLQALQQEASVPANEAASLVNALGKMTDQMFVLMFIVVPLAIIVLYIILKGLFWYVLDKKDSYFHYLKRYALFTAILLLVFFVGIYLLLNMIGVLSNSVLITLSIVFLFLLTEPLGAFPAFLAREKNTVIAIKNALLFRALDFKAATLHLLNMVLFLILGIVITIILLTLEVGQIVVAPMSALAVYGVVCVVCQIFSKIWFATMIQRFPLKQ